MRELKQPDVNCPGFQGQLPEVLSFPSLPFPSLPFSHSNFAFTRSKLVKMRSVHTRESNWRLVPARQFNYVELSLLFTLHVSPKDYYEHWSRLVSSLSFKLSTHPSDNHKEPPWEGTVEWLSQNAHRRCSPEIPVLPWDHWTTVLGTCFHALALHTHQYLNEAKEVASRDCACKTSDKHKATRYLESMGSQWSRGNVLFDWLFELKVNISVKSEVLFSIIPGSHLVTNCWPRSLRTLGKMLNQKGKTSLVPRSSLGHAKGSTWKEIWVRD